MKSGTEKMELLRDLLLRIASEMKLPLFIRSISYEDKIVEPNMLEGFAGLRDAKKEDKIVIYKNCLSFFWVYSEPGNPYYWYRYDTLSGFLAGFFKEPIRIKATNFGYGFMDHSTLDTRFNSAIIVMEKEKQEKSRLIKELSKYSESKEGVALQQAIFGE